MPDLTNREPDHWDSPLPRFAVVPRGRGWFRVKCVCNERGLCRFHTDQRQSETTPTAESEAR